VFETIEKIADLRERLARSIKVEPYTAVPAPPTNPTRPTKSVGLVPTMGALHAGHAELMKTARRECGVVVVSIFVNPLQFNNQDDLARYPRTLDSDLALCRELGVDIVFAPSAAEVYPQPLECSVDVGRLADYLCGKFRPGHFRSVATVVLKLFEIAQPHRAYFGEKDAQQLAIIRRLVADFNLPITIVEVPTVREGDGLAMSSRNRHLSADERKLATCLYSALSDARRAIANGERNADAIKRAAAEKIPHSEALKLEYFEVVDPATMQPVDLIDGPVRIAAAMWVGSTRLIDNVLV
jgi:pantoate--beta-alanine ligase